MENIKQKRNDRVNVRFSYHDFTKLTSVAAQLTDGNRSELIRDIVLSYLSLQTASVTNSTNN